MRRMCLWTTAAAFALAAASARADEDPAEELEQLNAQIRKTPDDPMLHYRKAQCLMKLARYDEGYETAKAGLALFIKKKNNLAWMLLETVDLEHVRVDVHFNMGPGERKPPDIGIVRPLSFRVWKKGEEPALAEVIDFEIAMFDGKPSTAAFGKMMGRTHANLGIMDVNASYAQIRKKALELIAKRHP